MEVTDTTRISTVAKPHYLARTVHSTGEGRHGMLGWPVARSAEAEWKTSRLLESRYYIAVKEVAPLTVGFMFIHWCGGSDRQPPSGRL